MAKVLRAVFALSVALLPFVAQASEWPSASDYLSMTDCSAAGDLASCNAVKQDLLRGYAEAIAGKQRGQRKVSFCLTTGCDSAVQANPVRGCAWQIVLIKSRRPGLTRNDLANFRNYCGPGFLDDAGRQAAMAQAKDLLKKLGVN